jgi:hypothetical protein
MRTPSDDEVERVRAIHQAKRAVRGPEPERLELVEARCDVETVERLRQSYGEAFDERDIEPWRLAKATEAVESVMVVRYRARRSDETTDQARTLANAALVAIDDCRGAISELQRIAVACDNGSKPEDKLEFIRRVARPFLHHRGGQYRAPSEDTALNVLARVIENRHGTLLGIGVTLREALAELRGATDEEEAHRA